MMDEHDGEEVIFLGFEKYTEDLQWRYPYDAADDMQQDRISNKARKALRGANVGDLIRIEISYDSYRTPVSRAMRVTGTDKEKIRLLTARVDSLEKGLSDALEAIEVLRNQTASWTEHLRNQELLQEI